MTDMECDVRDVDGSLIYIKMNFCHPKDIKENVLSKLGELGKDARLFDLKYDNGVSFVMKDNGILGVCKRVNCTLKEFFDGSKVMECCEEPSLDDIKLLLKYGATTNHNAHGYTPICIASENGSVDIVKLLLKYGATMVPNKYGNTPLNTATRFEHLDVVEVLLKHGATMEPDSNGDTPLNKASYLGNLKIVEVLLEALDRRPEVLKHGATMEPDEHGNTPLNNASNEGHLEIVKLLLKRGATMEPDNNGYTPLSNAIYAGHPDIVGVLKNASIKMEIAEAIKDDDKDDQAVISLKMKIAKILSNQK